MTSYRIREVDGFDDEIADTIHALNKLTPGFPLVKDADLARGHWWLGFLGRAPVSFAALVPSDRYANTGYFKRVAVLPGHRGHGLQLRHMRALESRARRNGWHRIVSDTTENVPSANNMIRSGYRLMTPDNPWSFTTALYWTKNIGA